jgi:Alkaline phosphatase
MKKLLLSVVLILSFSFVGFAQSGKAKYVFYFIGDGMGMNQVHGTEMYLGEKKGVIGTVDKLTFTQFPYTGYSKTYSSSNSITDSAAGGTALAVGHKTKNGTIGMDASHKEALESVAEKAKKAGKKVGIMTSVSIDHATPASFYAHQPSRSMAYEIGKDLAKSDFDFFAASDFVSPKGTSGKETDLFKIVKDAGYTVVRGVDEYNKKSAKSDKMILFQKNGKTKDNLSFAIDRKPGDLTLTDITKSAIDFMKKDNRGFFMMIEGGQIDWSAHSNDAATTFEEVIDMDNAIKEAFQFFMAHPDSTLIVVTADHETGGLALGRSGYTLDLKLLDQQKASKSQLSADIVDLSKKEKGKMTYDKVKQLLKEKLGFWDTVKLTENDEKALEAEYNKMVSNSAEKVKSEYFVDESLANLAINILNNKALIGWTTSGHSGAYVPVFAIGAGAEQFVGLQENIEIPQKIAKAGGY